jgi:hypothetical protein
MHSSVRFHWNPALALGLVLVGTSCTWTQSYYRVDLSPVDVGLERTLSIVQLVSDDEDPEPRVEVQPLDEWKQPDWTEVADRLERVYRVRPDSLTPYSAKGRFADIPEDLGNWGFYRAYRTPLGWSGLYVERFGGDPHVSATVAHALEVGDSLYDLAHLWLEAELGRQPGWPAARAYLDRELRPLLRNYTAAPYLREAIPSESWVYVLAEDIEHPEVFPFLRLATEEEMESPYFSESAGLARLRARLSDALGLHAPADSAATLAFLADRKHARTSMARAIAASRHIEPEEALAVWSRAVSGVYNQGWFTNLDSLVVTFEAAGQPRDTNGSWDADSGRVVWRAGYSGPKPGFLQNPIICYAKWSLPDSAVQRRLFGSLVLENEELDMYGWKYSGLDSTQKAEWDRTLLSLKPGKLKPLERFRFADERKRKVKFSESRARPLADLVLTGVRADSTAAAK